MYKILVVDDEPKIREVIREYGEFSGYEITEADDGITAVGLCKLNDYDLIIMDIMMPKLDGFSACKEIKKQRTFLLSCFLPEEKNTTSYLVSNWELMTML